MARGDSQASAFDVIIVGGGSAGCVLASRLSADPARQVLLLEAGPRDTNPWIHVPGGYYRLLDHPTLSWNFEAGPEPGLDGRLMTWPRGRVLGGSSAINGMVYIRGQAQDFDMWRQRGCAGWGWADVLPYFRRAEDQSRGSDAFHGTGGPLVVSDISEHHLLSDAFIEAAGQWGLPRNGDFNGATQEGAGYYQLTARGRRRSSVAATYLRSARSRRNLTVLTGAQATRVLLQGNRATGVRVRQGGRERDIHGREHVVLAAGAIQSPHLLLLSGIGPADALQAAGVAVLHDLPGVGQDLQDHLQVKLAYRVEGIETINEIRRSRLRMAREGMRFVLAAKGPLANGSLMAGGFVRSDPTYDLPDVQLHFQPLSGSSPGVFHNFPGCTLTVSQMRPESRGAVWLRSADPAQPPAMRANYLATAHDRRVVVAALRLGREMMRQPAFRGFAPVEVAPGAVVGDDSALLAYARANGFTQFHLTSSCRMGTDDRAVVDPELHVRGLDRLLVADASVMPAVVSGNTNAAAVMIGEKAADLIIARDKGRNRSEPQASNERRTS